MNRTAVLWSQLTEQTTDGRVANAVILATIDGVELRGPLQVVERPGFVTLNLYWAPKDRFDKEEPTLRQVLTCFNRKTLITSKKPVIPRIRTSTTTSAGRSG